MITGNVSGPCMSGFYYLTAMPKTNLFLLIIEDWKQYKDTFFYNFNCKIAQRYNGHHLSDNEKKIFTFRNYFFTWICVARHGRRSCANKDYY